MADTYTVERTTDIHAPAAAIYPLIADFREWRSWSPFEQLDTDMQRTYAGPQTGAGSTYEWSGNMKAGTGRMQMTEVSEPIRVVVEQRNTKPFKSESTSTFSLVEVAGVTTVTWSSTGPMTLMAKALGIFKSMDGLVGPLFESGLAGLKSTAEAG